MAEFESGEEPQYPRVGRSNSRKAFSSAIVKDVIYSYVRTTQRQAVEMQLRNLRELEVRRSFQIVWQ